jgi:uncharacterized membrane protein YphA (DoxX/SURF4 family)
VREREAALERLAIRCARIALGTAFLSAVGSRFGLWGGGNFAAFEAYTAKVNSFLPALTIPYLARVATVLELAFGVLLLTGLQLRWVARGSAVVLGLFGIAMAISFGIQSPLDYSVFSASACAFLLSTRTERGGAVDSRQVRP